MKARIFLVTVLTMIAGFMVGIQLSEIIGIVGALGFGRAAGIKYLPIYLAIAAAMVANIVDVLVRRKSRKGNV